MLNHSLYGQDSAIYKYFIIIMNQDSATAEVKCTILLNAKELDLNYKTNFTDFTDFKSHITSVKEMRLQVKNI